MVSLSTPRDSAKRAGRSCRVEIKLSDDANVLHFEDCILPSRRIGFIPPAPTTSHGVEARLLPPRTKQSTCFSSSRSHLLTGSAPGPPHCAKGPTSPRNNGCTFRLSPQPRPFSSAFLVVKVRLPCSWLLVLGSSLPRDDFAQRGEDLGPAASERVYIISTCPSPCSLGHLTVPTHSPWSMTPRSPVSGATAQTA